MKEYKYFKPRSLTWWASVVPLTLGLLSATEPLHEWAPLVRSIGNMTGDLPPFVLINVGLAGIGLRGAKG